MKGYTCTRCGLTLPSSWGGQMYVTDNDGKRSICPHPGEEAHVALALGIKEEALIRAFAQEGSGKVDPTRQQHGGLFHLALSRTGFLSDCLCRDCLAQFKLDVYRDSRRCPHCSSSRVKTANELLKRRCPKCKKGTIDECKPRRADPPRSFVRPRSFRWEDLAPLGC